MKKRIIFTIVGLLVLIGVLGGIKGLQISRMVANGKQFAPPPETVTAAECKQNHGSPCLLPWDRSRRFRE